MSVVFFDYVIYRDYKFACVIACCEGHSMLVYHGPTHTVECFSGAAAQVPKHEHIERFGTICCTPETAEQEIARRWPDHNAECQWRLKRDKFLRQRIAGQLRDMGKVIEAHEAQQNTRYDDPDKGGDVTAGLVGAMAQALHGVDYHVRGAQQVGCDIAAGMLIKHKKPDPSPAEMMLLMSMMGGGR